MCFKLEHEVANGRQVAVVGVQARAIADDGGQVRVVLLK